MSKQKQKYFKPQNTPFAAFEMYSDSSAVLAPASALALSIPDQSIRSVILNLSINNNLNSRKNAFETMIKRLNEMEDSDLFLTTIRPICSIFNQEVIDFYVETRVLSLKLVDEMLQKIKQLKNSNETLVSIATYVFPPLLLLSCDSDEDVSKTAKGIFWGFFPTPEKRNGLISKLRKDISLKLKSTFDELKKPEWSLSEKDKNDNWGRVCSAALILATNVLGVCKFSKDLFSSFGEIPLIQWLKLKDGHFEPRVTPVMRSSAYQLIGYGVQCNLIHLNGSKEITQFISADTSTVSQAKLISLVNILIQKNFVEIADIQKALYNSYELYYNPKVVNLSSLIGLIKDEDFIHKSLLKVALFKDVQTASNLFDCVFNEGKEFLNNDFLAQLLLKMIATNPPSHFYAKCKFDYLIELNNYEKIDELLNDGNELRIIQFLNIIDLNHTINWLKSRETISPEILNELISKQGCKPIRIVWPSFSEIPIKINSMESFVEFLLSFIHSDEIKYVIENYPESIPFLLKNWTSNNDCFRCDELLKISPELLEENLGLAPCFVKIFPDNQDLLQLIDDLIIQHIKNDNQFDPSLFEYIKPSDELLDTVIFSDAISILLPDDKYIIPYIIKRINELVKTSHPITLAKAAAKFVEVTNIDPRDISVPPKENPLFCYEYWNIIGFDNMLEKDFCCLLNYYLDKKCKWLSVYLYIQNINWNFVPKNLWNYLAEHPNLITIAHKEKLLLALACLNVVNNFDYSKYKKEDIDGLVMFSLPVYEPIDLDCNDDKLANIIKSEWNQQKPSFDPNDFQEKDSSLLLRQAISYIQYNLPVINEIQEYLDMVKNNIDTDNLLNFFYCIRILGLLAELNIPFQPIYYINKIIEKLDEIQIIPSLIELELSKAFQICKYFSVREFNDFSISIVKYFTSTISPVLSRLFVPYISFFNSWNLIETCFGHKLDLNNVKSWYFITNSLLAIPYQKRIDLIPSFSENLKPLLSSLSIESDDFLNLITAFPTTAMKWSTKLPNSKALPIFSYMERTGSLKVFNSISSSIKKLNLEYTTINIDNNNRTILAVYNDGPASIPVKLSISFPKRYPFCQVKVNCEFGDESANCEHKVSIAIINHQTIEAGIKVWHQFVTYRLRDAEPCTICYSYLSEEMKKPNISCPTCGQKFHGKCLQKWFTKCMKPTCPYCASDWDEKKRKKEKK